jgi:hypothetical protein
MSVDTQEPNIETTTLVDAAGVNLASVSAAGAVKVDGSAITQPISAASLPLPTGAATAAGLTTIDVDLGIINANLTNGNLKAAQQGTWTVQPGNTANTIAWKVDGSAVTQPISGSVSLGVSTNKTNVLKTGTLVTTATTANQVVLTYTVTGGTTFFVEYVDLSGAQTTPAGGTSIVLGTISLETPSGTKTITRRFIGGGSTVTDTMTIPFAEPIPVAAGVVIRVVVTPNAASSMTWLANFGGYER